jgi:hypothetical protein
MTPGYKTTEFWLSLSAVMLSAALGYLQTQDANWAVVSASVVSIIYTLVRSSLKNKAS